MKISSINYLLPALLLIGLTGCMGSISYLDHQNDSMNGGSTPVTSTISLDRAISESKIETLSNHFFKLIMMNSMAMLGLLALCSMWLLARAYNGEKQRQAKKYDIQDLGLLKIARNNLNRLWENHRPGRKIVRLEEWKG